MADTIKIGLLIPDKDTWSARDGAELAIFNANTKSNRHFYKLETRDMAGPWGTGSKVTVDLIFKEKVLAIVGSVDSRNSHLAEQVTAKSRVVFLNASSGDQTLAQAFVPWYFSCFPNFAKQALILVDWLSENRKQGKIIVAFDDNNDSKLAYECFVKTAGSSLKQDLIQCEFNQNISSVNEIIKSIKNNSVKCIIIFGHAPLEMIYQMRKQKVDKIILGSINCEWDYPIASSGEPNGVFAVSPVYSNYLFFSSEFENKYGYAPGAGAAYAYDAVNLLIEAIKKTNNNPENLRESLLKTKYEGVTGKINFDDKGNRTGEISQIRLISGSLLLLKTNKQ